MSAQTAVCKGLQAIRRSCKHDLHTSSMEPAAAAADLPPGKASPRQGWANITLPALLASTLLRKAKKAEGAPHWGPPPPLMKNNSRPASKISFHHNCLWRRHNLMQVCRLRVCFAVKACIILCSSATIRQAVKKQNSFPLTAHCSSVVTYKPQMPRAEPIVASSLLMVNEYVMINSQYCSASVCACA